ncbi:MAG TPA: DnaA/Hda family protein, partial [Gaiellaceae bacterium]
MEQEIELTAEDLWNDVSTRLREALNDTTYSTWFGEVDGEELDGDRFVLAVPNDFTRDWIEGHFLDLIRATVRDVAGGERQVGFRVIETAPPQPSAQAIPATVTPLPLEVTQRSEIAGINPKYTFDSFVIGSSNRFAHAAALAVAEAPAQAYNPLFIYGHTGLGKTHLLHAIANFVTDHGGGLTCRYVTSETFMNDFINSLRDKRIEGFK